MAFTSAREVDTVGEADSVTKEAKGLRDTTPPVAESLSP
jgi:hypothetical protein